MLKIRPSFCALCSTITVPRLIYATITVFFFSLLLPITVDGVSPATLRAVGTGLVEAAPKIVEGAAPKLGVRLGNKVPIRKGVQRAMVQNGGNKVPNNGTGLWQKLGHNNLAPVPTNQQQLNSAAGRLWAEYQQSALKALEKQWRAQKKLLVAVRTRMMFGLEELPAHANQLVHVPVTFTRQNAGGALARTMHYVGEMMYNEVWRLSKAMKRLPPRTGALLATIFGAAETYHTRDEWSQATLTPVINPEGVGFSVPHSWDEFHEGLVNAALDILPDFAFAVPVSLFVANPPAAILWAGWMAVGEYFAKKTWSLVLRDAALESEHGKHFLAILEENKISAKRVFEKRDEEEEESDAKMENTESPNNKREDAATPEDIDMVSIMQALSDSQVDSNLYQYLFMNTLRAYFVTATSIHAYFMSEIEKAHETGEELTEFAQKTKKFIENDNKMAEEMGAEKRGDNSKGQGVKGQGAQTFGVTPKRAEMVEKDEMLKDPAVNLDKMAVDLDNPNGKIFGITSKKAEIGEKDETLKDTAVNLDKTPQKWIESMWRVNDVLMEELEEGVRNSVEILSRGIVRHMVYRNPGKGMEGVQYTGDEGNLEESMRTMAQVIMATSSSPQVLEEMVKVKLGNKQKMPICGAKTAAENENEIGTHKKEFSKICQMPGTEGQQVQFMPLMEDKTIRELGKLFKDKAGQVLREVGVLNKFRGKQNVTKLGPAGTSGGGVKKVRAVAAAMRFQSAGRVNRLRQNAGLVVKGAKGVQQKRGGGEMGRAGKGKGPMEQHQGMAGLL